MSDDVLCRAAGVLFLTPDNLVLFLLRQGGDRGDRWVLPAGGIEDSEGPSVAAAREAAEEVGWPVAGLTEADEIDSRMTDGIEFHTFLRRTDRFVPILNYEYSEFVWAPIDNPPSPLHPGLKATLQQIEFGDSSYDLNKVWLAVRDVGKPSIIDERSYE